MTAVADLDPPRSGRRAFLAVAELGRDEWQTLRSMRLAALYDAPHAFVTPWAVEWCLKPADWLARFVRRTWVVARLDGQAVGIACLAPPDRDARRSYFVESVWVDPHHRWRGVLREMLDHLQDRARDTGATELRLWILDTNEAAGRAYLKLGFSPLLDRVQKTDKQREDGTAVKERLMSKPLW